MRMGRWEEAEAELLQAFEKNPKDADTLANLAVVSLHLGKNASRYLGCVTCLPGGAVGVCVRERVCGSGGSGRAGW